MWEVHYNGYSASQLKAISECIAGIPGKPCPSYSASTVDHYTGTVKHENMPTGVISTKSGWLKWADAAMKANSYDGVYGLVKLSSANDTTHSVKTGSSTIYFRLVGINQDDRSDGLGKAGLTFQAIGTYSMPSSNYNGSWKNKDRMNNDWAAYGGWRDSELRKSMNNGIIWNVFPSAFMDNVAAVNKITNNNANSNVSGSVTTDKLWILSPSEMGMPVYNKWEIIYSNPAGANVHVYDGDRRYDNTVKTTNDGNRYNDWRSQKNYLYSNDSYQWWMLHAGDRKMSDGNHSYHNTDSYSYCAIANGFNPSSNTNCIDYHDYWLRSHHTIIGIGSESFSNFDSYGGNLFYYQANQHFGVVPAFSF